MEFYDCFSQMLKGCWLRKLPVCTKDRETFQSVKGGREVGGAKTGKMKLALKRFPKTSGNKANERCESEASGVNTEKCPY